MRRIVISIVLLPWLLGLGFGVVSLLSSARSGSGGPGFFPLALFFTFFVYFFMAVTALPLLGLCLWRKWTKLWHGALVGALTGLVVFLSNASSYFFNDQLSLSSRLHQLGGGYPLVLLGAFAGAMFWFMAFWPERHSSARGARDAA